MSDRVSRDDSSSIDQPLAPEIQVARPGVRARVGGAVIGGVRSLRPAVPVFTAGAGVALAVGVAAVFVTSWERATPHAATSERDVVPAWLQRSTPAQERASLGAVQEVGLPAVDSNVALRKMH